MQQSPQVGVGSVPVHGEDRSGDGVSEHTFPSDRAGGEDAGRVRVDRGGAGEFTGQLGPDPER